MHYWQVLRWAHSSLSTRVQCNTQILWKSPLAASAGAVVSLAGDWLMSMACSPLAIGLPCFGAAAVAADGAERELTAPVAVLAGAALSALFLTGLPEACT